MDTPKVTFIVPCYKLAHLLTECVESILSQTYRNVEVLIMDDCSPDNTAEVARGFTDPRVTHVRNEPNLGHLKNYNKGIALATGEYIWLISADDKLRVPHAVARYVEVMEANPRVGYAFCPGLGLRDGRETEIVNWATLDGPDAIMNGRVFLRRLLQSNCVLAPAGLVRRECYDRVGAFPLDLPFAGDWYLWCLFALHYDVAYFAEPMVNYREHSGSMTDAMIAGNLKRLSADELAVRWRMKSLIEQAGDGPLAEHCRSAIVDYYVRALSAKTWRGAQFRLSLEDFDESLRTYVRDAGDCEAMRRDVLAAVGDHLYWDSSLGTDVRLYRLAVQHGKPNARLWTKYAILRLGPVGALMMRTLSGLRAVARRGQTRGAS
jgi:glycosyltransferase involved in cell wall biosynthesis